MVYKKSLVLGVCFLLIFMSVGFVVGDESVRSECGPGDNRFFCQLLNSDFGDGAIGQFLGNSDNVQEDIQKLVSDSGFENDKAKKLAQVLAGKENLFGDKRDEVLTGIAKAGAKDDSRNSANQVMTEFFIAKGNTGVSFDFKDLDERMTLKLVNDRLVVKGGGNLDAMFATENLPLNAKLTLERIGPELHSIVTFGKDNKVKLSGATFSKEGGVSGGFQTYVIDDDNQNRKLEVVYHESGEKSEIRKGPDNKVYAFGDGTPNSPKLWVIEDEKDSISFSLSNANQENPLVFEPSSLNDDVRLISGGKSKGKPIGIKKTVDGVSFEMNYFNPKENEGGQIHIQEGEVESLIGGVSAVGFVKDNDGNLKVSGDVSTFRGEGSLDIIKPDDEKLKGSIRTGAGDHNIIHFDGTEEQGRITVSGKEGVSGVRTSPAAGTTTTTPTTQPTPTDIHWTTKPPEDFTFHDDGVRNDLSEARFDINNPDFAYLPTEDGQHYSEHQLARDASGNIFGIDPIGTSRVFTPDGQLLESAGGIGPSYTRTAYGAAPGAGILGVNPYRYYRGRDGRLYRAYRRFNYVPGQPIRNALRFVGNVGARVVNFFREHQPIRRAVRWIGIGIARGARAVVRGLAWLFGFRRRLILSLIPFSIFILSLKFPRMRRYYFK